MQEIEQEEAGLQLIRSGEGKRPAPAPGRAELSTIASETHSPGPTPVERHRAGGSQLQNAA